jgi:hypothetical protein
MKLTQKQYDAYQQDIDDKWEQYRREKKEFQQFCINKYLQHGHSEGLADFITEKAIGFNEIATEVESNIRAMEKMLSCVEIVEEGDVR